MRIHIAPAGSALAPPLGELADGTLVVPEGDGVRLWQELKGVREISWTPAATPHPAIPEDDSQSHLGSGAPASGGDRACGDKPT